MKDLEKQFGISAQQILDAKNKVVEAMKRKNVAEFKDEESKENFFKLATFWLCIPLITEYRVRYQNHYDMNNAEYFIIDFDRDEDHEEVAFPELVFKYGNTSLSVIEIEPYQEDDNSNNPFQAVLTEKAINLLFDELDFIKEVDVKANLANLFNLNIEDKPRKYRPPLSSV